MVLLFLVTFNLASCVVSPSTSTSIILGVPSAGITFPKTLTVSTVNSDPFSAFDTSNVIGFFSL